MRPSNNKFGREAAERGGLATIRPRHARIEHDWFPELKVDSQPSLDRENSCAVVVLTVYRLGELEALLITVFGLPVMKSNGLNVEVQPLS